MKVKTGVLLFLSLCILLISTTVSAAELALPGVGIITAPDNIESTETTLQSMKAQSLLVNDRGVWRSAMIAGATITNGLNFDAVAKNPKALEQLSRYSTGFGDARILQITPFASSFVGAQKTLKSTALVAGTGYVLNLSMYILPKDGGVAVIVFASADGDAAYWQPIAVQMLANIKL